MLRSLVGSEMCIRDSLSTKTPIENLGRSTVAVAIDVCSMVAAFDPSHKTTATSNPNTQRARFHLFFD